MEKQLLCRVGNYFPQFQCKMGRCRQACCQGWPVSIDRDKYFQLLGVACDPALRRRLDTAMPLADYPTPQRYAQLSHRYDGDCALRDPDGRCGLQVQLGEEILPDVCRLYPRSIRQDRVGAECVLANSCEAVCELFWDRKEPLAWQEKPVALQAGADRAVSPRDREGRLAQDRAVAILQDRRYPLARRLQTLCPPELSPAPTQPGQWQELTEDLRRRCEAVPALSPAPRKADQARELFLEHLLVNHAWFTQFPTEPGQGYPAQYRALCLTWALANGALEQAATREEATDRISRLFRFIQHTHFTPLAEALTTKYRVHPLELAACPAT